MRAIIDTDYQDIRERFRNAKIEPLSGWPWLEENRSKKHPEQIMTILYDGKPLFTLTSKDKKKSVKAVMDIAGKR
jgi:hypothetical protein